MAKTKERSITRFISWNVKGVNNNVKISRVLSHLQHLRGDVFFLQETHLKTSDIQRLKRAWVGHLYHSKFSARARGAAILIHRSIPFELAEVLSDPNGRYVIITGKLRDVSVIMASIYAPNWDDDKFISNFFSSIPDIEKRHIIVGGDFNFVQDTVLDRSSSKPCALTNSAKTLNSFAERLGLSDPWKSKFPTNKAYSFFSHVHHSYSRIDFFLVDNRLLSNVLSCEYHSIVISDHAPTSTEINLSQFTSFSKQWYFPSMFLARDEFKQFLTEQIALFFEINDMPSISRGTLWETFKAYLRGMIISYISGTNKANKLKLDTILKDLQNFDRQYAADPNKDLYKERLRLQTEFDLLTTNNAEALLLKSRQRFFEMGDKAGKLLAHQARASATSRLITGIRSPQGDIVHDSYKINSVFLEFYSDLYTSELPPCINCEEWPLDKITFPKIDSTIARTLGDPVSISEVVEAIKLLQSGKSPGPDGFTIEFYKAFSISLAPALQNVFNEAFSKGCLPPTLSSASITLIAKKDKDPHLCGSYRPISLLNVDYKILTKILSLRLQQVLPQIISADQTGFMIGRHSFYNTRKLINILNTPNSDVPEVVLTLDAEKAFDRVEWRYLLQVMESFGFDDGFISWVKLLYVSPQASVLTNGVFSSPFLLQRGTRQGCPLSPLLFAIAIEPLAIWLREEVDFKGIKRIDREYKLSLYADDLILFISDPVVSVPIILSILNQFGKISGYKINFHKSELFPVNSLANNLTHSLFPFRWAAEGFKYLGIFVTKSLTGMYVSNFVPLLKNCESDMERWANLPFSLAGRISLIKMIVLPKFLYLFQHIPIYLKKKFFMDLDKRITSFLWGNKPARINKTILQLPKNKGGLALPNFLHYYWACNIQKILHWRNNINSELPSWAYLEQSSARLSLNSVISSQLPLPVNFSSNLVVSHSVKIWTQFRKHTGLHRSSILSPIFKHHCFAPSIMDEAFRIWFDKGIKTIDDLYESGIFSSFNNLSKRFDLPNSHLFRFFQVRHFVQKLFPHFPNRPPESPLDDFLKLEPHSKHCISVIYNLIHNINSGSANSTRGVWEESLGFELPDEHWERILELTHTSSICARHGLIQCKILHRVYYTNARLAKIYPSVSDACNRCKQSPANLIHMLWECPKLFEYWTKILKTLKDAFNIDIDTDPLLAIFGLTVDVNISVTVQKALAFTTLLARRLILLKWKHVSPPSFDTWLKEVFTCIKLEKIRLTLTGSLKTFDKVWRPFLDYLLANCLDT